MTLAEMYEKLTKVDGGSEYVNTIKAEISKLNTENAKQRTGKNAADAKVAELQAKVGELTAKGTGDQGTMAKMQKQLDQLGKKLEEAETARKEEHTKRVHADMIQKTVAALTKGHAANPNEISKILIGSVGVEDDGSYKFTNAKGEKVSIEEGAAAWLKENPWAVSNTGNSGAGTGAGGGEGKKYTMDDLKHMSREDINTHWAEISKQLQK